MTRYGLTLLRVLLAALFAGALLVQAVFFPLIAWAMAQDFPEVAYLAIPYAALAIGTLVCAQVILVATWRLAGMVEREQIFDQKALPWVTVMVRAATVATAFVSLVALHGTLVVGLGPVTVPAALIGAALVAGACTAVLVVLRGLLRLAVHHKVELDAVV